MHARALRKQTLPGSLFPPVMDRGGKEISEFYFNLNMSVCACGGWKRLESSELELELEVF